MVSRSFSLRVKRTMHDGNTVGWARGIAGIQPIHRGVPRDGAGGVRRMRRRRRRKASRVAIEPDVVFLAQVVNLPGRDYSRDATSGHGRDAPGARCPGDGPPRESAKRRGGRVAVWCVSTSDGWGPQ